MVAKWPRSSCRYPVSKEAEVSSPSSPGVESSLMDKTLKSAREEQGQALSSQEFQRAVKPSGSKVSSWAKSCQGSRNSSVPDLQTGTLVGLSHEGCNTRGCHLLLLPSGFSHHSLLPNRNEGCKKPAPPRLFALPTHNSYPTV